VGLLDRLRDRDLVPGSDRANLDREGVVVDERNVSLTVRFEDYRAPGRRHVRRHTRFRGALVVTRQRLVVFMGSERLLDAPFSSAGTREVDLRASGAGLEIGFDAGRLDPRRSGRVDMVARVAEPQRVLDHVRGRLTS